MTINELQCYLSAVKDQYISKEVVIKMLYNMAGGYDYIETELRGAIEKVSRQEADEIWEENGPLEDDLDDFLREIYEDTGYDDQDLEGMLEEWEADDAEDNN